MHSAVAWPPSWTTPSPSGRVGGIAGLVYASVRGIADLVGQGIDWTMTPLAGLFGERFSTPQRDLLLSVVNGVVGDHLAETGNPLALPMQLRRRGTALDMTRDALGSQLPRKTRRVAVFVHGLCGTDAQWKRPSFDYARAIERDHGFTPVYLRYNSGLHISTNGRHLAALLDELLGAWPGPLDELLLVGHSMGGLLTRSAYHQAMQDDRPWTAKVRRMAFLGSPHHGAPLERGGQWFEEVVGSLPLAAPLSRLGRLRSAGVTDLRHGNLLDEDWQGVDRFAHRQDRRRAVALPEGVDCLAVAATTGAACGDARDRMIGDGLVPVASALGQHRDPGRHLSFEPSRCHVIHGTHHMELLGHPEVYERLSRWLAA